MAHIRCGFGKKKEVQMNEIYELTRAYRVRSLTAARFAGLRDGLRRTIGGKSLRLSCRSFSMPETGRHEGFVEPTVGLMPFGPARFLDRGPLAYTVFCHRGVEAACRQRFGTVPDLTVTLQPTHPNGFHLIIPPREGAAPTERLIREFVFETDVSLDHDWFRRPQDGAFLDQTAEKIAITSHDALWDRSRKPWPRLPYLHLTQPIAYELAAGLWIALPSWMATFQHENIVVPALVLDPVRYAWREGVDPRHLLLPQNAYLAADLSGYGDWPLWEKRLRCFEEDPDARLTMMGILSELCVERATGKAPERIDVRPFVWTRVQEF